ncbi:MAG: LEPR-XLL domain-containing protein, partial [Sedimentisphaerales bacterium]|nr:LEPR-XLL domain-containing protein [Sedimentisphaerales bacterium]
MVLERLKHIKDQKLSSSTNSNPVRPILLERLEPRILLSGDSLLSAAAPDSLHDMLLDNTQQMVQYAELLDTDEQVEQQLPNAEQEIYREAAIYTLHLDAQEPLDQDSLEGEVVSAQQSESDENPLEESGSGIGIALVLGVDLLDQNDVEPISKDVDSECFESCQRQLILEQLTDTLRIPHGPPDAEGVLTSLDDVQLEYIDAGGQIDLVVRLNTQNSTVIEVFDNNRGGLLASHALSEINSLTVIGGDNSNDILTVDLSNPFSIPGGIVFVGGDGGYDKLVLIGNSELTAEYVGNGDDDGTVIVSGEEGETTNVSYSGLEPFVYLNEFGAVKNSGIFNYGNSPAILNVEIWSQTSADTLKIE